MRAALNDEEVILASYWSFLQGFRSKKDFSLGDARAYISALVDLYIAENGLSRREDLLNALRAAIDHAKTVKAKDYSETLSAWRELDRDIFYEFSKKLEGKGVEMPKRSPKNGFNVISLFTGSYGLDLGFEYAGLTVRVALDVDKSSKAIVEANRPEVPFILRDIKDITTREILAIAGLGKGDVDVVTGGPPCQPFSPAGKRHSLKDPRASPLMEFIRVIKEAEPKAFVMEEVPGLISARIKHVPISERGKGSLSPEEEAGSAWRVVLEELKKTGYRITYGVLNAADYGTPQVRERLFVIGLRPDLGASPSLPEPTHRRPDKPSLTGLNQWVPLLDAIGGVNPGEYTPLPPKYARFLKYVPPGGNWRQIPQELRPEAMNGAYDAGGGRMGFYRRLTWFEPSPTLVTSPAMKATMMIHPWEDRPLSVDEYKAIQGFPEDWVVPGSVYTQYRKIGEAVPPILAYAVASAVVDLLEGV